MNNITIELCAEDRARLDRIAELLEAFKGGTNPAQAPKKAEAPATTQAEPKKAPEAKAAAQEPKKAEAPAQPVAEAAPEVKLEDVQRLVVELATNGKKAEARDIVKSYAERVTEIPADKYPEVFHKLRAVMIGG